MTTLAQVIVLFVVALGMYGFIKITCLALECAIDVMKRYAAKLAADNRAEWERRKAANNE